MIKAIHIMVCIVLQSCRMKDYKKGERNTRKEITRKESTQKTKKMLKIEKELREMHNHNHKYMHAVECFFFKTINNILVLVLVSKMVFFVEIWVIRIEYKGTGCRS